jgi:glycosyltransferase involved in cell wall biosynthesis
MCRALAESGFDVHLVAPCDEPPAVADTRPVTVHGVARGTGSRPRRFTKTVHDVFRRALELDGEIYHFHDPELLPVGAALRRRGKLVIYDVHEDVPGAVVDKPWLPGFVGHAIAKPVDLVERFWARRMSAIIGADDAITSRFGKLVPKAISIHNYPRLADFPPPRTARRDDNTVLLVSFGGLNGHRCADMILNALSQLENEVAYRLIVAGRSFGPAFEEPLRSLPAYRHMDYRGRVSHEQMKASLYDAQLAFVMYSPSPNHMRVRSNRFFEAMSAGIPVITSDFPHWREMVESVGCGLAVSPRDPAAIANAVRTLLANPEQAAAMGLRGRRAVERQYSWEREQERLVALYRVLLTEGSETSAETPAVAEPHVDEASLTGAVSSENTSATEQLVVSGKEP